MPLFERARLLFVGDLFDGPDVRRYAWADERDAGGITVREHFRRLFVQATVSLAGLRLETDQVESALELYREASELEPTDERVWLSLFRIHARRGDRPALVREERRLRAALRELVDDPDDTSAPIEPSRSLTVEFQRLLAELDVPERQPATV
jgi:two-component SAPR family response regulator